MTVAEIENSVVKEELFDRLLFLVDVQNLFYSARDAYGVASRVDFRKLKDFALDGRKFKHIRAKAYFAAKPGEKPDEFIKALQKLSYEVELINIREHEKGEPSSTNIDVVLATDASNLKVGGRDPSIVIVASGDSDFNSVYAAMKSRGISCEVLSFPGSLAASVIEMVGETSIKLLGREILFEEYDGSSKKVLNA